MCFIYTYYQDASGNNSVIDHIFVSEKLLSNVVNYYADDSGINMSDHLPVVCTIKMKYGECHTTCNSQRTCRSSFRRWDKADLKMYYNRTFELLQNVHVPSQLAYLSISVTLWVVLTGRVATIIMAVLFLLCVELWMKLFLYLNRIQYIEIILVC